MPDMEPKQAACFRAAINAGSVRAAAEQMGLEPSTVSRNIAALEKVMATTLIERGRHGVRSTDAGSLLLSYLKRREGELDLLRSELDALANMTRGKVVIAVGEGFVGDFFDSALASFSTQFPDISFSVNVGSTDYVMQQVISEQAHLGVAYNVVKDPGIRVESAVSQPLIALVRRGGIYDRETPLDIAALSKIPCAIPPKTFGIGAMIAAVEAKYAVRLRGCVETGSIAALKAFVRNDMGCTILPRFVVETELSDGTLSAYKIASDVFSNGVSSLIRKEGRKLPQAASLLLTQLRKMSALS
ncbi:MAG: LysR family transcriptional regulator [Sulfitobacter sp.]